MQQGVGSVVVADDNAVLLNVLSEILKECGFSVRKASDGLEALFEIREQVPDILLSDLNMPRMSGFELLSIVRRRYPAIRVIAMSGGFVPEGVAADAFYEKNGTSIAQLLQMTNALVNNRGHRLNRTSTPIWRPGPSATFAAGSPTLLACPECLDVYSCSIDDAVHGRQTNCPRCQYGSRMAIVPSLGEKDRHSLVYFNS